MNNGAEILFAEDRPDDAIITIRALEKSGLTNKMHHVKDGAEALDYIYCTGKYTSRNIQDIPKLLLLDLKMPKVSGIEVLQKIKSDPVMRSIPVAVLTSSEEEPDLKKCYALGVKSYILKPVWSHNLFQVVTDLGLNWTIQQRPSL